VEKKELLGMYHGEYLPFCSLFIGRGGTILYTVAGITANLSQGGLELLAKLMLTATSKEECTKAKKLIEGTSCIDVTRDVIEE